jgi:DNA polymerase-3 subunit chi
MTRVDFYILDDAMATARAQFVCRLAEKAWQQGHKIYIHTDGPAQSSQLDELLWTFRAGSFLPHSLDSGADADSVDIHIGHGDEPMHHDDVLINMGREVPLFFSRFERVAEVIAGDEAAKQDGRQRFRFYRERGYPLQSHTIRKG